MTKYVQKLKYQKNTIIRDIVVLSFIVIFSLTLRVYPLNTIPHNVTGDEITYLADIYKIIIHNNLYLFSPIGDGSETGLALFLPILFIKTFTGIEHALFSLRLASAVFSVLALIPFYFIIKRRSNWLIGTIFTILLSTNYVFLNFSRTGWIFNTTMVFLSLSLLLCLEKLNESENSALYIISGIISGVMVYGYLFGKFLILFIIFYLVLRIIWIKNKALAFQRLGIYLLLLLIISAPYLFYTIPQYTHDVSGRASATFVFSHGFDSTLAIDQIKYALEGNILLDSSVMNRGMENQRYVPNNMAPVSPLISILFIFGLIYLFLCSRFHKFYVWWIVFISIIIIQAITALPPNLARGLLLLPFIYLVSAITVYSIWAIVKKTLHSIWIRSAVAFLAIVIASLVIYHNLGTYFSWQASSFELNSREPAINYQDFPSFQKYQINAIKNNQTPITVYQWDAYKKMW